MVAIFNKLPSNNVKKTTKEMIKMVRKDKTRSG